MTTNEKVLASREYSKTLINATITNIDKKLNSNKANWNQNDETALDYVKNRPFYSEVIETTSNVLTWDGNIDGLIRADIKNNALAFYKVSDVVLELSDLVGGIITLYEGSKENLFHIQSDTIQETEDFLLINDGGICVAKKDNTVLYDVMVFPKAGIYFPDPLAGILVSKLELSPSSTKTFTQTNEVVHKLDAKYLDLDWLPIKNTRQVIGETTVTNNLRVDIPYLDVFYSYSPRKYHISGIADVYFDGVLYTLPVHMVTFATYNTYFIGNLSLSRFISYPGLELVDTGEPFCIYSTTERDTASEIPYTEFYVNDDKEHAISVFKIEYNKMPETYLPDTVADKEYVATELANLVGTAPDTLDTIEELATAFQENEDIVETLNQAIGNKADKTDLEVFATKEDLENIQANFKTVSYENTVYAVQDNQTVFKIGIETFDAAADKLDVHDGRLYLTRNLDYTVSGQTVTLTEGVNTGDSITFTVLKNVPILDEEITISPSLLAENSIPLSKLESMPTADQVGARPSTWMPTASDVGAYSKSEIDSMMENVSPEITINGKPIDENGTIELNASDIGARPDTWMPTAAEVGAITREEMNTAIEAAFANVAMVEGGSF